MIIEEDGRVGGHQNPFACIADIKRRNRDNEGNFTNAEKAKAETLKSKVEAAFQNRTALYGPNFRKGVIVVKVTVCESATGRASDRMRSEYTELMNWCSANGVRAISTSNNRNINFHI